MKQKFTMAALLAVLSVFASCTTMLEKAAWDNDVELAKKALAEGEKIDEQKHIGLQAARQGNTEFLEFLLGQKYDFNYKNDEGRTLLHAAVSPDVNSSNEDKAQKEYDSKIRATEFLLKQKVDVNAVDNLGVTPLLEAVGGDAIALLKKLKRQSDKIATKREDISSLSDSEELNKMIREYEKELEEGRKRIAKINSFNLPFEKITTILLQAGAKVNQKEQVSNFTELHFAVWRHSEPIAKALVGKGANVNAQDIDGNTPLHLARNNQSIYNQLIQAKADPKIANKDFLTPYDMATWRIDVWQAAGKGDTAAVEEYLKLGGSVDGYGYYAKQWGWTPLHVAAYEGRKNVIDVLLQHKADLNPLFRGDIKKVDFPFSFANLNPFANIQAITSGMPVNTPLVFASKNEKKDIAEYLTSKGAIDVVPFMEVKAYQSKWQQHRIWGYTEK